MKTTTTDIASIEACILRLFRYISTEVYEGKIPTPEKVCFDEETDHLRLEQVTIFDPQNRETTTASLELVLPTSFLNTEGIASILTNFMAKLV